MARICDRQIKRTTQGYERIFGIKDLADLISKIQSTAIANGQELEKIVSNKLQPKIPNLYKFLENKSPKDGIFFVTKAQLQQLDSFKKYIFKPDFIVFKNEGRRKHCYIIELKDGYVFDTKKSYAEAKNLRKFKKNKIFKDYVVSIHIACFNQSSREEIIKGFKHKIKREEAMTGEEFCKLCNLNYHDIIQARKEQESQKDNTEYFCKELLKIPEIRSLLENSIIKDKKGFFESEHPFHLNKMTPIENQPNPEK